MPDKNKDNESIFDNLWFSFPLLIAIGLSRVYIPYLLGWYSQVDNSITEFQFFSSQNQPLILGCKTGFILVLISFFIYLFFKNFVCNLAQKRYSQEKIIIVFLPMINFMFGIQFLLGLTVGYCFIPNILHSTNIVVSLILSIISFFGFYCTLAFQYQAIILTDKRICSSHIFANFMNTSALVTDIKTYKFVRNKIVLALEDGNIFAYKITRNTRNVLQEHLNKFTKKGVV